jgi:hypothetical protein
MSKRSTREEWRARIAACERSGLTQREFAARNGLNAGTLSWWKWRLRADGAIGNEAEPAPSKATAEGMADEDDDGGTEVLEFVELAPVQRGEESDHRLEVVVGAASVLVPNGFDANTLRRVLDVLEVC